MKQLSSFEAADGLKLLERRWQPEGEPRAVVALIHGAGEHSGRYNHLATFLTRHGYSVAAFDLRGHGRSSGRRLYVRSLTEYVDDAMIFLSRLPDRPTFLLGHSLGGTIASLLALTRSPDVEGLILTGPFLGVGGDFSPAMLRAGRVLGRILPHLPLQKIDPSSVSRDSEVVEAYISDPLVHHGRVPAGTGAAIIRAIQEIEERERELDLPVLVMHGTADRIADVQGSRRFHRNVRSDDKTLKLYDGLYHEVLNEPEKQQVMQDLLDWLEAHGP